MNLPFELINHILTFRPTHPTAKLIKKIYNDYLDIGDDYADTILYYQLGRHATEEEIEQYRKQHPELIKDYYMHFYEFVLEQ